MPNWRPRFASLAQDAPSIAHYAQGSHGQGSVTRWSQADLWSAVEGYGALIADRTRPGELVMIVSRTKPEAMAAFLGAMAANRVPTFFPPQHPIQDAPYFLHQQRESITKIAPDLVMSLDQKTHDDLLQVSPALKQRMLLCEGTAPGGDATKGQNSFLARISAGSSGGPLFVQHSSGTTGVKKACAIDARLLQAQYDAYWQGAIRARITDHPLVASWLPIYHDMGLLAAFLLPVLDGAPMATIDTFDWVAQPQRLFDIIEAEQATLCWMPNFAFRYYVRLKRALKQRDLSSVRAWVNCSEPCRTVDAQAFEDSYNGWAVRTNSVVGCYAMAETVFAATQALPGVRLSLLAPPSIQPGECLADSAVVTGKVGSDHPAKIVLSSGSALPTTRVCAYVDGAPVSDGVYGELGVAAPFVFDGYRGLSSADSTILPDGIYMTGDLGVVLRGEVFVFGRTKEIIIVAGKNLYAGDIEAAVGGLPGIRPGRTVAFGLENAATGSEELVIVAERDPAGELAPGALRVELTKLIQAIFLVTPRDVRVVESRWLVKSTSGKISREANRAKYVTEAGALSGQQDRGT